MNYYDIQKCANFYKNKFVEQFYIVTTFNKNSFILIAEKNNFPHLMGIKKQQYISNGYGKARKLYDDILLGKNISPKIVPINIVPNSKMYNKALNFCNATDIFADNNNSLIVNYDPAKSSSNLGNVDRLILSLDSGYMLGCCSSKTVNVSNDIQINSFSISSWIDESNGSQKQKEKYLPNQDVELIHTVITFNAKSDLVSEKEFKYRKDSKKEILEAISRNHANLLINKNNENAYVRIAKMENISCMINGKQIN